MKHPKLSYDVDHQIFLIDKTDDGVHLISATIQLSLLLTKLMMLVHKTFDVHEISVGAKAFHADHVAHGCNNEDQMNDALGKMNKFFNFMCKDLQTIRR